MFAIPLTKSLYPKTEPIPAITADNRATLMTFAFIGKLRGVKLCKTLLKPIREIDPILTIAKELLESIELENHRIRLLGISLSNLDNIKECQGIQLPLFQSIETRF